MLNEVDVEGVDLVRLEPRLQLIVHPRRGHLLRNKAQSLGNALDVRIDREGRPGEGEEQHTGRGLGTDTGERGEPTLCLLKWEVGEEAEFPVGATLAYLAEERLQAFRLGRREATWPDRLLDLPGGGGDHRVPCWKPLDEPVHRMPGIVVGCVLREECQDELEERGTRCLLFCAAVALAEDRDQLGRGPSLISCVGRRGAAPLRSPVRHASFCRARHAPDGSATIPLSHVVPGER